MSTVLVLLAVGLPFVAAVIAGTLSEERRRTRAAAVLALALGTAASVVGVTAAGDAGWRAPVVGDLELVLRLDGAGLLFAGIAAGLWPLAVVYARGYLEDGPHQARFHACFSACVGAALGIAFAGNLFTLIVFYEVLSVAAYPLVAHRGDEDALAGARTYLAFTLTGGTAALAATIWLHAVAGTTDFEALPAALADVSTVDLRAIVVLLLGGFAVKAAVVPLHRWLPLAMVAPTPVSGLLHAVAVVNAGAFSVIRVLHDVAGLELVDDLGLLGAVQLLAAVTILYGSLQALRQVELKPLLAYSTVSQLSYIVLAAALPGGIGTLAGGLAHLVHQGTAKIALFFAAGVILERLGITRIDDVDGLATRLPLTAGVFAVGSLSMIGVPPTAGFVTKWQVGTAAAAAGAPWAGWVLALSGLLAAAYLLPVVHRMWFRPPTAAVRAGRPAHEAPTVVPAAAPVNVHAGAVAAVPHIGGSPESPEVAARDRGSVGVAIVEPVDSLVGPTVVCVTASVVFGVLAGASWSPLSAALRAAGALLGGGG